jgi:hypothetical protein
MIQYDVQMFLRDVFGLYHSLIVSPRDIYLPFGQDNHGLTLKIASIALSCRIDSYRHTLGESIRESPHSGAIPRTRG